MGAGRIQIMAQNEKGRYMKSVHITDIVCVRVVKEIIALRKEGIETTIVCAQVGVPDLIHLMGPIRFYRFRDFEQAAFLVTEEKPDIVHVHSEPAGLLAVLGCEQSPLRKAKFVLDIHDSVTLSSATDWIAKEDTLKAEAEDFKRADAVIVPSETYFKTFSKIFSPENGYNKKPILVRSLALDMPKPKSLTKLPGIAYWGGLTIDGWRDYKRLFTILGDIGWPVYAYAPGAEGLRSHYDDSGCVLRHCEYFDLMRQVSRHSLALIAPPSDGCKRWLGALPNKYFEAIALKIPILTWGCPDVALDIQRYGGGIVCADESSAIDVLRTRLTECKARTKPYTWAREIEPVVNTYQRLTGKISAGVGITLDTIKA